MYTAEHGSMFLADSKPDNEDNCYREDCDCKERNYFASIIDTLNLSYATLAAEMATSLILFDLYAYNKFFIMAFHNNIICNKFNNDKPIVCLSCLLIMLNGIF